jgi:predicted phosphodiesterase
MRTLIVSDLHLGSRSRSDLLRRAEPRAALLAALADVERVVLLGDVLELRHGPLREAMACARPFFEELGQALAGRELVIAAGNHDHALIEPWLMARGEEREPPGLALEQLIEPAQASRALERIAGWAAPARVRVAYPGLWVRPDVYATHGHYLDSHLTMPTLERLTMGAMSRVLRRPARSFASVADYEAVAAPVYAWRDAVARDAATNNALNGIATLVAWQALGGGNSAPRTGGVRSARNGARSPAALARRLRARALAGAFPLAVGALNLAGLGPLSAEISGAELRRAGLEAMGEVAARLGLADAWVIFGHTHRAGPLPGDDQAQWRGRGGARLVNAGNWTYAGVFLTSTPGESPYWPGSCVLVDDSGPPLVLRLLQDRTLEQIKPLRAAAEQRPA